MSKSSEASKGEGTTCGMKEFEKDVKAMFDAMDKNGDKCLSIDELGKGLKALGFSLTYKEMQAAAQKIDNNKNGKIEYSEFKQFMMNQHKKLNKEENKDRQARQAFRVFDRDGNGFIEKSELRTALKSLGQKMSASDVQTMMNEADKNKDGVIDYEEFLMIFKEVSGCDTEND